LLEDLIKNKRIQMENELYQEIEKKDKNMKKKKKKEKGLT
jgi:hypothetical protein